MSYHRETRRRRSRQKPFPHFFCSSHHSASGLNFAEKMATRHPSPRPLKSQGAVSQLFRPRPRTSRPMSPADAMTSERAQTASGGTLTRMPSLAEWANACEEASVREPLGGDANALSSADAAGLARAGPDDATRSSGGGSMAQAAPRGVSRMPSLGAWAMGDWAAVAEVVRSPSSAPPPTAAAKSAKIGDESEAAATVGRPSGDEPRGARESEGDRVASQGVHEPAPPPSTSRKRQGQSGGDGGGSRRVVAKTDGNPPPRRSSRVAQQKKQKGK